MPPPSTWSLGKPMGATLGNKYPSSVHALQYWPERVPVDVVCGKHQFSTTGQFSAQFQIYASPLQCYLEIRLNLKPGDPHNTEFAHVRFLTYVDGDDTESRVVQPYSGQPDDTIPGGPFNFGRQIRELKHVNLSDSPLKDLVKVDKDIAMLHVFSWKAQGCVKIAFSRPTQHSAAAQALGRFQILIEHALSSGEAIHVITRKASPNLIRRFRWLLSSPVPMPVSFWPWMRKLSEKDPVPEGEELMDFSHSTFELDTKWVDTALAVREKGWFKQQTLSEVPEPLTIIQMPEIVEFNDWRQYLAYVLGGHTYECQENRSVFGHDSKAAVPIRDRLIKFMSNTPVDHMWFFDLLLAQDNYYNTGKSVALAPHKRTVIERECNNRNLNMKQKEAVKQYFSQSIAIVVGLPGTGKSALVNTIVAIEEKFHDHLWLCTGRSTTCNSANRVGAASGPLLSGMNPSGLIMNNSSQIDEASAVSAIIHALNGGKLKRILLIGDHHQEPPTVATRNPFGRNSRLSLLKRLVLAGTPHVQLKAGGHPALPSAPSLPAAPCVHVSAPITEASTSKPVAVSGPAAISDLTKTGTSAVSHTTEVIGGSVSRAEHDALRADHDALRADHDVLRADHDALRKDHEELKAMVYGLLERM
ncbi:hypothetical protein IWZ01DRAFT_536921 [Phyllosticta capitalensis]